MRIIKARKRIAAFAEAVSPLVEKWPSKSFYFDGRLLFKSHYANGDDSKNYQTKL